MREVEKKGEMVKGWRRGRHGLTTFFRTRTQRGKETRANSGGWCMLMLLPLPSSLLFAAVSRSKRWTDAQSWEWEGTSLALRPFVQLPMMHLIHSFLPLFCSRHGGMVGEVFVLSAFLPACSLYSHIFCSHIRPSIQLFCVLYPLFVVVGSDLFCSRRYWRWKESPTKDEKKVETVGCWWMFAYVFSFCLCPPIVLHFFFIVANERPANTQCVVALGEDDAKNSFLCFFWCSLLPSSWCFALPHCHYLFCVHKTLHQVYG